MAEVNVIGTIHGASFIPQTAKIAFARWKLFAGSDWKVVSGASVGSTILGEVTSTEQSPLDEPRNVVWSQPFDVRFDSHSIHGWPQIAITVWQQDDLERNEIVGYGTARIPPSPGIHVFEIPTWRPQGSVLQELSAWFLKGGHPHLTDTRMITDPIGGERWKICSVPSAVVRVELHIAVRGMEEAGVILVSHPGSEAALGVNGGFVSQQL